MLKNKKRILIIVVVLLITAVGSGVLLWNSRNSNQPTKGPGGIDYGPPSEEVIRETEQFKQDLERKTGTQNSTPSGNNSNQASANVAMTYLTYEASKVNSAGYISNFFEDGGTCTLTLTKGSLKITGSSTGLQDVNKTTCPEISIDRSKLQAGEWLAVLSYASAKGSGSSPAKVINVP